VTDTWEIFDRLAERYDTVIPFFRGFADQLVELLDPPPGTRLLDVGCGRGALAVPAAARGCTVTAIDRAPRMVKLLAAEHPELDVRVMDAHHLDLPDASYDIVTCGFMIHIVPDPARVLAEMRRVVRPGGTVAFIVPGDWDDGGRWDDYTVLEQEFRKRQIGPGRSASDEDIEDLLPAGGFADVREHHLQVHIPVADAETCWRFQMSHGFARFVEALSPADAAEFRERAFVEMERMKAAGGIIVDRGAYAYLATAP
jgi:ubiquinone/menaquinone biosynthesis C-methylase UbiE